MDKIINSQICQIIEDELKNPTLESTKEIISTHKNSTQEFHKDLILRIQCKSEDKNVYLVYIKLFKQPYYFVIILEKKNELFEVLSSYIDAYVQVYICIYSDILSVSDITFKLQLKPTKVLKKGDFIINNKGRKCDENRWYFEPQINIPGELEEKVSFLLEQLSPLKSEIKVLSQRATICVHINYQGYEGNMGGFHFDSQIIKQLSALNVEVDVDLYSFGPLIF